MGIGNGVERHETDIMPVGSVFRAGVSKSNEQLHRSQGLFWPAGKVDELVFVLTGLGVIAVFAFAFFAFLAFELFVLNTF